MSCVELLQQFAEVLAEDDVDFRLFPEDRGQVQALGGEGRSPPDA